MAYNNFYPQYGPQQRNSGRKKSGAKWKSIQKGKRKGSEMILAWMRVNGNKDGLFLISCFPLTRSKHGKTSQAGHQKFICQFTNNMTGEQFHHTGYFKESARKLYIPKMNIVVSPNAPNGGFCGRVQKR